MIKKSKDKGYVSLFLIHFLPLRFIDCDDMATQAISAVQKGDLQIHPDSHRQAWFEWLKNIKDWCVSRQLWWGHRIPVYCVHRGTDQETWVAARSREEAEAKFLKDSGLFVIVCE